MKRKCHPYHNSWSWLLGIVLAVSVAGCQQGPEVAAPETGTPTATASATVSATVTATRTPSASPTRTVRPTKPNTPTRTPTWTPLPTLSQEDALERLQTLTGGDDICRLPCWGGIVPGKTTWDEAKANLSTYAQILDNPFAIAKTIQFVDPRDPNEIMGMGLRVDLYTKIVYMINTYRYDYRLDQLLSSYGPPAEVWLSTDWDISVNPFRLMYTIILFYPDQGFLAAYEGNGDIDPIYDLCPSKIDYELPEPVLKIWVPDPELTFKDVMREYGVDLGRIERYDRIEKAEMTSMDVQEFYEIFREPENADRCVRVPGSMPSGW